MMKRNWKTKTTMTKNNVNKLEINFVLCYVKMMLHHVSCRDNPKGTPEIVRDL